MARTTGAKDKIARRRKRSKVKAPTIKQLMKLGGSPKRRVGRPAKPKTVTEIMVITGYDPRKTYTTKRKRGRPKKIK